jgi:hypothetical protein
MKNIITSYLIFLGTYLLFGIGYYLSGFPLQRCEILGHCFVMANVIGIFLAMIYFICAKVDK